MPLDPELPIQAPSASLAGAHNHMCVVDSRHLGFRRGAGSSTGMCNGITKPRSATTCSPSISSVSCGTASFIQSPAEDICYISDLSVLACLGSQGGVRVCGLQACSFFIFGVLSGHLAHCAPGCSHNGFNGFEGFCGFRDSGI